MFSFYQKNLLKTHREEINALREQLKEAVTSRADAEAARKNDDVTWKERMTSLQEKHSKEMESLEKKHLEVLEIKLEEARLQWQQVRDTFFVEGFVYNWIFMTYYCFYTFLNDVAQLII